MAPTFKVTYFGVKGLGESIRFLLSYGGVDFEDCRIEKESWPAIKPTMPFGKMPVLEVDGKKVHQSVAICRYLGKQFKLAGDNDWEAMEIDIVVDTFNDMKNALTSFFQVVLTPGTDEETKAKLKAVVLEETFPFYFPKFEEILKKNDGYFVNGKLTWADFYMTPMLDSMGSVMGVDILADYPLFKAALERVNDLPAIKAWIAKRPVTSH